MKIQMVHFGMLSYIKRMSVSFLLFVWIIVGCSPSQDVFDDGTSQSKVSIGEYGLFTYQKGNGDTPILFESGLADFANVWNESRLFDNMAITTKVIAYNRAGYRPSDDGPDPRTVQQINLETKALLDAMNIEKVVLVSHSLGGMYSRSFAINYPEYVAALVFLDPSHEAYQSANDSGSQAAIDFFEDEYGSDDVRYKEALQLEQTFNYVSGLANLPDIPVVVITSTKESGSQNATDRENWFNAHAQLGEGITDFTHLATDESGHYIMIEQPGLVIETINSIFETL